MIVGYSISKKTLFLYSMKGTSSFDTNVTKSIKIDGVFDVRFLDDQTIAYQTSGTSPANRDLVMLDLDLKQKSKIEASSHNSSIGKLVFDLSQSV